MRSIYNIAFTLYKHNSFASVYDKIYRIFRINFDNFYVFKNSIAAGLKFDKKIIDFVLTTKLADG